METKSSEAFAGTSSVDLVQEENAVHVLRYFRVVFNAVKTHFRQIEKRTGIGGAQIWALSVIKDRPGVGMTELATAIDVRQPTASNMVRLLVDQGLVEIRREGSDKRSVQLHLLKAGRQILGRAPAPFAGLLPDALARLDPITLTRLEADLRALVRTLNVDEASASIPLAQIAGLSASSRAAKPWQPLR